jgi:hypothetical protein
MTQKLSVFKEKQHELSYSYWNHSSIGSFLELILGIVTYTNIQMDPPRNEEKLVNMEA